MKPHGEMGKPTIPSSSFERLRDLLACGGTFVLALLRLYRLVANNAVDIPYGDQWDTLTPLFDGKGPLAAFFQQHGPHRLGLGGFVDWYLYQATGWDVRAESWACLGVLVLATVLAIGISIYLRGRLSWHDAAFPLILLSPVSWETMLLTPFLAHAILPLLIVMSLALAWSSPAGKWQLTAIGLMGSMAFFSGFGFCAALATFGLSLLQIARPAAASPSRLWQLLPAALFLVSLGIFLYGYTWNPAVPGWRFPVPNWWDYARVPALMFTSLLSWGAITPLSTAVGGAILALCLAAWIRATLLLLRRQESPRASHLVPHNHNIALCGVHRYRPTANRYRSGIHVAVHTIDDADHLRAVARSRRIRRSGRAGSIHSHRHRVARYPSRWSDLVQPTGRAQCRSYRLRQMHLGGQLSPNSKP